MDPFLTGERLFGQNILARVSFTDSIRDHSLKVLINLSGIILPVVTVNGKRAANLKPNTISMHQLCRNLNPKVLHKSKPLTLR